MSIIYVLVGLALLVVGGEYLVKSSVSLSLKMSISKVVVGMTVVSFATSAPELIVSLQAAINGHSDISLGNVIGSNIANIALVLGLTAIISPLTVSRDFYRINWPGMLLASLLLYFFLQNDGLLSRMDGFLLLVFLVLFLVLLLKKSERSKAADSLDDSLSGISYWKILFWLSAGGLALWGGSVLLVDGAVKLAQMIGVSERTISISVIAIGTSIPELAASIIAAVKKEKSISLGNLIGSNIFNIGSVLGLTALIQPIRAVDKNLLSFDIYWMLVFAAVLLPLVFIPKQHEIGRLKGMLLFASYIVFIYMAFL